MGYGQTHLINTPSEPPAPLARTPPPAPTAPPAVFLPVVRPKMRCIMAVMDQKESLLAVACARLVLLVFYTSRCVPCCRSQALMPCIMAGMDQMFLDMVVHTPVVCNDICLWSRLLILRSLRSCSPSRSSTSLSRRRGSLSWSRQFVRP